MQGHWKPQRAEEEEGKEREEQSLELGRPEGHRHKSIMRLDPAEELECATRDQR